MKAVVRMVAGIVWLMGGAFPCSAAPERDTILYVQNVILQGNKVTRDEIILREMSLLPDVRITKDAIEFDRSRIYSLRLFNKVDIAVVDTVDTTATIVVTVDERWYWFPYPRFTIKDRDFSKASYGAGLAYSNLFGSNVRLAGTAMLGFNPGVSFGYTDPNFLTRDLLFSGAISYSDAENQDRTSVPYRERHFNASTLFGRRFDRFSYVEGWAAYDVWTSPVPGRMLAPEGKDAYPTVGIQYTYEGRNLTEYATEGLFGTLTAAKYGFGSRMDLFNYACDLRAYLPLGGEAALCGRGYASLFAGGPVPPYLYQYLGRMERIRGHSREEYQGENLTLAAVELRLPLLLPRYYEASWIPFPQFRTWRYGVYAAVFANTGNLWLREPGIRRTGWMSGAGAGLHFLLPYSIILRTEATCNENGVIECVIGTRASF